MAINILIGLALIIFTFGQIGRLTPFEIPVYGNVYEVFLFLATILLVIKIKNPFTKNLGFLIKSFIIFISWTAISLFISLFWYNSVQNVLAVMYFGRLVFYYVFLVYFVAYIQKHPQYLPMYKKGILFVSVLVIAFSLIQYFLYPNIGNIAYAGWDPHLYRLVGLFLDPPLTAGVFFLLALGILFSFKNLYLKLLFVGTLGVLFFLTYSRGGFLALLVTILVYSFRKMKIKYLLLFIAASLILITVIPKNMSEGLNLTRTTSIGTRLEDYNKAYRIWQKNPVLGIGYNHIRAEKDSYEEKPITEKYNPSHASASFHSSFLMVLATTGIVGLIFYLIVVVRISKLSSFGFYSTVFLSVYSLTDNLLLHPFILFLWFVLIGVTLHVHNER